MEIELKYCLYARKSSEQDERQAMSIDSQIKEMRDIAEREGLNVVEIKYESHSAKLSGSRPVLMELIQQIRDQKFNAILTWAPDRLSRNAGDLGSLVDLMDSGKLAMIKTHSQVFTDNPNEKFLLMILCSQAKLENDNRAINVKRGIRAKCEMGWRPCMPPLGYYTRASTGGARDTILDGERAPYIKQIFYMASNGKSGRHIRQWLVDNNVTTRKGKDITLSMIYNIMKNTFYYGEYEYPVGSGNWYKGSHEALITKELFQKARKELVVPQKSKWGAKEFPFRRFLTCGSCGSQVVGEEKFKKLKNGTTNRHIYYHCSRQVDDSCREPFVREDVIISGLLKLSCKLCLDSKHIDPGLTKAVNKYEQMTGSKNAIAGYAQYVLDHGSDFEKSRLVRNVSTKLLLHNKVVTAVE